MRQSHFGQRAGKPEAVQETEAEGDEPGPARMVHREFVRTASRLREMQSKDYFSRKHASAENPRVLSQ